MVDFWKNQEIDGFWPFLPFWPNPGQNIKNPRINTFFEGGPKNGGSIPYSTSWFFEGSKKGVQKWTKKWAKTTLPKRGKIIGDLYLIEITFFEQKWGTKNGPFLDPSKKSDFTTKNFGGRPDFQKSTILSPFFTFLTFFQKTRFFGQNIKNPYSLKVQKSAKIDHFWVIFGPFFRTWKNRLFLSKLRNRPTSNSKKWSKSGSKTDKNSDSPLFGPLFDRF